MDFVYLYALIVGMVEKIGEKKDGGKIPHLFYVFSPFLKNDSNSSAVTCAGPYVTELIKRHPSFQE